MEEKDKHVVVISHPSKGGRVSPRIMTVVHYVALFEPAGVSAGFPRLSTLASPDCHNSRTDPFTGQTTAGCLRGRADRVFGNARVDNALRGIILGQTQSTMKKADSKKRSYYGRKRDDCKN
jgi:hypothetical protein